MKTIDTKGLDSLVSIQNIPINETVAEKSLIYNLILMIIVALISFYFDISKYKLLYDITFGVLLTYIIDIMLVQSTFVNMSTKGLSFKTIGYENVSYRFKYMFNHRIFYKYMVVVFIGYILNNSIMSYIEKQIISRYKTFINMRYKKEMLYIISIFIQSVTSLLLLNFMKFRWAYIDLNDSYLTAMILSLFSIMVLIIVRTP